MTDERASTYHRRRLTLRIILLALLALPLLYLAAAVAGALMPRNPGWEEPPQGVLVFVRDNGVHVDLVLPASAAGFDLYRLVSPAHIADPESARGWVAFGWGQREFYLETPRWADLTARNAARAVFGGDTLMHIEHVARPRPSPDTQPLRLERHAYRRLVAAMTSGFVIREDGSPIPLLGKDYADNDIFYEGTGHYNAFRTSNQWTAEALADAGVKIGLWTPFAQGMMWRFRDDPSGLAEQNAVLLQSALPTAAEFDDRIPSTFLLTAIGGSLTRLETKSTGWRRRAPAGISWLSKCIGHHRQSFGEERNRRPIACDAKRSRR